MSCADSSEDETYEVGDDLENDDPPRVGDVDFGIRVLCDLSDFVFGQMREFDFHR